jgi:hypothetical protein
MFDKYSLGNSLEFLVLAFNLSSSEGMRPLLAHLKTSFAFFLTDLANALF